jgi:molybdenum ABC transporter molybdate-binding protein
MKALVIIVLVALVAVGGVLAWKAQSNPPEVKAPEATQTLYVAVPMGIYLPFTKVEDLFKQQRPDVKIKMMIDTPEAMCQMVEENEEKPDIFISPGGHELEVLREKGYIDPASEVAFGSYQLAIVVPKANPGKVKTLEDLLNPEVKVISISDPNLNAACYAARQSLQNLGLWDKLEKSKKFAITGCCMSSYKWVLDGKAEANVQFLGCPMDEKAAVSEASKVSFACKFPTDSYYVPRNVAGILKTTKQRALAEEFLKLLTAPETIEMMYKTRLRNDQSLPPEAGPWGPEQEANPKAKRT